MWSTDEILRRDNFNDLSKNDLLDIILILRNDLKYYKYRKDSNHEQISNVISTLKAQLEQERMELIRVKGANTNFHNKIMRPLTVWERIKGRIDLKN